MMNSHIHAPEHLEREPDAETLVAERNALLQCGLTAEEITSLLWMRQWYQTGSSDRVEIVRRLEFLKLLVNKGKMKL